MDKRGVVNGGEANTDGDQQSTTTITTVAVQAGKAKIVLAILKVSHSCCLLIKLYLIEHLNRILGHLA